jgi:hypothetical protein
VKEIELILEQLQNSQQAHWVGNGQYSDPATQNVKEMCQHPTQTLHSNCIASPPQIDLILEQLQKLWNPSQQAHWVGNGQYSDPATQNVKEMCQKPTQTLHSNCIASPPQIDLILEQFQKLWNPSQAHWVGNGQYSDPPTQNVKEMCQHPTQEMNEMGQEKLEKQKMIFCDQGHLSQKQL